MGGGWEQMEEDYRGKEITLLAKSPHIPLVGKGTLLGRKAALLAFVLFISSLAGRLRCTTCDSPALTYKQ